MIARYDLAQKRDVVRGTVGRSVGRGPVADGRTHALGAVAEVDRVDRATFEADRAHPLDRLVTVVTIVSRKTPNRLELV